MPKLSKTEVEQRVTSLNGWTLDGDAIKKQYTFGGFPEAMAFVNRLAPEAEAADHHPDIHISYKRVTLTYSTHSEGGLTAKDFAGAVHLGIHVVNHAHDERSARGNGNFHGLWWLRFPWRNRCGSRSGLRLSLIHI